MKKCSTAQRFICKDVTSYKIHTLVKLLKPTEYESKFVFVFNNFKNPLKDSTHLCRLDYAHQSLYKKMDKMAVASPSASYQTENRLNQGLLTPLKLVDCKNAFELVPDNYLLT